MRGNTLEQMDIYDILNEPKEKVVNLPFEYISLFSGIGGFEQGLNELGGKCVMASEIDKYANAAYEVLYGHKTVGDITKVLANNVPYHDLLVGGFPCQAFSVAGKQLGFNEARGTLFFEIAKISKEKKPKMLFLENVKGLVSHDKGKTLDTIVLTLNEIGYTVDFEVLNSKYFDVPQNRERIFIVAVRDDLIKSVAWDIGKRKDVVGKGKKRIAAIKGIKTFNFDWPKMEHVNVRLRDILETNVDEKYYLSEEKTTKLIEQLQEQEKEPSVMVYNIPQKVRVRKFEVDIKNLQKELRGRKKEMNLTNREISSILDRPITEVEHWFRTDKCFSIPDPSIWLILKNVLGIKTDIFDRSILEYIEKNGVFEKSERCYDINGLSPTLTVASANEKIIEYVDVRATLTPDRVEKKQNGRRFKDNDEPSFTLTAQDIHGVAISEPIMVGHIDIKGHDAIKRVYSSEGLAPTLTTMGGGHREPKIAELCVIGNTNPSGKGMNGQVYDAQGGLAPTLTTNKGEGVKILIDNEQKAVEYSRKGGIGKERETSLCLSASDWTGLNRNQKQTAILQAKPRYRIRKLTPLECWRLQGFKDQDFYKVKNSGISDSQLYKMAGNAVTVNVIAAIGEKIVQLLNTFD